jgi:hypothetical protein
MKRTKKSKADTVPVIITLTTIPERLNDIHYGEAGIQSCIMSLCAQTYKNVEIHFNIPTEYKLHKTEYTIPEWLSDLKQIKIFRVDDEGPATKILPTIRRITDKNTIIIVVDDDQRYHPDMVTEHVKNQKKYKNCAIGYDALDVVDGPVFNDIRDHYVSMVPQYTRVRVLQHYKSVSYKRSYFEEDLFTDFVGKTMSDDVLLSAYMGSKNIHKMVASYKGDPTYSTIEEWQSLVGMSFPITGRIAHSPGQGCGDPLHVRFFVPPEFDQLGYMNR